MTHYYFVSYQHANGLGACEPYTTDVPLTTTAAMVNARESIARAISQPASSVVITFVMPLPDEKYRDPQRYAYDALNSGLKSAGLS